MNRAKNFMVVIRTVNQQYFGPRTRNWIKIKNPKRVILVSPHLSPKIVFNKVGKRIENSSRKFWGRRPPSEIFDLTGTFRRRWVADPDSSTLSFTGVPPSTRKYPLSDVKSTGSDTSVWFSFNWQLLPPQSWWDDPFDFPSLCSEIVDSH